MGIVQIGASSGAGLDVQTNTRAGKQTLWPVDVGALGSFSKAMVSGTMAAGLAAGATIFSWRNSSANIMPLRRVLIGVAGGTTAFAAGTGHFDMFFARAFTASASGGTAGTLTGNNGKLRTAFATTTLGEMRISTTAALTNGTRTLDTDPMASLPIATGTTADLQIIAPNTVFWQAQAQDMPALFSQNEGFEIQATVPATGTWIFAVQPVWDELGAF